MVLEMPTKSKRRKALQTLPPDLDNTMEAVIARIQKLPSSKAKLGLDVLMWLHLAYQPFQLTELQHALSVEAGQTQLDLDNIPSQKVILDSCLGLVILDKETGTIRFVHYTLEEYFRGHGEKHFPNGSRTVAEICLIYLNFGDLIPQCQTKYELCKKMEDFAFLRYAAVNWGYYVARECDDTVSKLALKILERVEPTSCPLQVLYGLLPSTHWDYSLTDSFTDSFTDNHIEPVGKVATEFSGVHVAAHFGLAACLQCLCLPTYRVANMNDDTRRTPLSWAAENGHEGVVQLLLARDDVEINTRSNNGQTPLSFAAGNGHKDVVKFLLARDKVDVNIKSMSGYTSLSFAAEKGHKDVVQLLLERRDMDINTKDSSYGQTPLLLAAKYGHKDVVHLLLSRDVDLNTKDSTYGQTPLSWAAINGHKDVVQLLLSRDVDVNTKGFDYGQTPLSFAAAFGRKDVVQLLLARDGVDINSKDSSHGHTPLTWAVAHGHKDVVQLLLARDVDVNIKGEDGKTAADFA